MTSKIHFVRIFVFLSFGFCTWAEDNFDSTVPLLTTTTPPFSIRIRGPNNVTLPLDNVTLTADVFEEGVASSPTSLTYLWEVMKGGGTASTASYNKPELILTELHPGILQFRVTVSNGSSVARSEHVLTVHEPVKPTMGPRAIIHPEGPIHTVEGNVLTLDAEASNVAAPPARYQWTQLSGPSLVLSATNVGILKIEKLSKGEYKFQLTVTDEQKREDSATVDVFVQEERDDPPKARITQCGSDSSTDSITVRLPIDKLELCANSSTDDKGVISYRWFRVDKLVQQLTVDLEGTNTPILILKNLQANEKTGAYEFQLDVYDVKKQNDSTRVSVFVNAARNMPPVPDAGGNRTLLLPDTSLVLEGNVKDDGSILSYSWEQASGPTNVTVLNADQAKATVSNLAVGLYSFRFIVVDDGGLNASDVTWISVQRGQNTPPVAVISNISVSLPATMVSLDGSKSFDDAGITAYKWTPSEDVPASIQILGDTDRKPVLMLSGLVEGTFRFNFTIRDQQGELDQKWVWLSIQRGEAENESVEMFLRQKLIDFTALQRSKLENRMSAILSSGFDETSMVDIHTTRVEEDFATGKLRVVLWAEAVQGNGLEMRRRRKESSSQSQKPHVLSAERVVKLLRDEKSMQTDFAIDRIETLYCKLDCSGHGTCSDHTKECSCERFWMSSLIGLMFNGGRHMDCAWSSVYFTIFVVLGAILSVFYLFSRRSSSLFRRRGRKSRRRRRYSPLHSEDSEEEVKKLRRASQKVRSAPRLQPLPMPVSSDSLNSESDDLLPRDMRRAQSGGWESVELRERGNN